MSREYDTHPELASSQHIVIEPDGAQPGDLLSVVAVPKPPQSAPRGLSALTIDGSSVLIFDVLGKDSTMFHFAVEDDVASMSMQYVDQSRKWFESVWTTIAREPQS
jgi:hypothetical protein